MQLPMMDFILCDGMSVVEGWFWFSRKGRAFLYSQVTSSRWTRPLSTTAKGQSRLCLGQSILSPAASARQHPRFAM